MNWFGKWFEKREAVDKTDHYTQMFLANRNVQMMGTLQPESLATVYACVQLISETIASLPLPVYNPESKDAAINHPLHRVLNDQANGLQTAFEFREQYVGSCLLTGNAYAQIERNERGQVVALWPLPESQIKPERTGNRVRYLYTPEEGGTEVLLQHEVMHLKHRSVDGLLGRSPLEVARETFDLGLWQQKHSKEFLKKNGRATGGFRLPDHQEALNEESFDRLKIGLQNMMDTGQVPLLEQGLDYVKFDYTNRDAQFFEQQKKNVEDICRIFRVPPPAVGALEHATYSNITEQSLMLVKHCLRPWMVRIEACMRSSLLTDTSRKQYDIEHNAEGLLRGSTKERFESYEIGKRCGFLSTNEIRELENRIGIGADGDRYEGKIDG